MKNPNWTLIAAVLGLLGVGLGAFGAHGLERVASEQQLEWWRTGVLYHLLHVAPLLALAPLGGVRGAKLAGIAFTAGVLLFSGTLYAMALGATTKLGMVTPLGGLALMVGWAGLAYASTAGRALAEQNAE
jgi:uncharacterized membrane protein YgdD (TMEM256/DUF423 family)